MNTTTPTKNDLQKDRSKTSSKTPSSDTVSNNTGPKYLRNHWNDFSTGKVTPESQALVRQHLFSLDIDESTVDRIIARHPDNIQHLAFLV